MAAARRACGGDDAAVGEAPSVAELGAGVSIAVTGWAADASAKYRLGVDHALPLSDHADYDQLIETVRQVEPKEIFCTHGPAGFAEQLCELGFNAYPLQASLQRRLF